MSWQQFLGDLEAQFEAQERAELAAEVSDRTRRETAAVGIGDRLTALLGRVLTCYMLGGLRATGRCAAVGAGWVLIEEQGRREVLIPIPSLTGVAGVSRSVAQPGVLAARLQLGHALRGIARDRSEVTVWTTDGSTVHGTVDRVGSDHFDVAEHAVGEVRRHGNVTGVRMVPTSAVSAVTRA